MEFAQDGFSAALTSNVILFHLFATRFCFFIICKISIEVDIQEVNSYNVICIQTDMIMTAVGAFQWKGGYQLYKTNDISDQSFKSNSLFQAGSEHDSYLGENRDLFFDCVNQYKSVKIHFSSLFSSQVIP